MNTHPPTPNVARHHDIHIGDRAFGVSRTCIIAEVAQAHDGSLGTAHSYIDAIADSGADAVKFQTHIASAESTKREPWRIKFSHQDKTRYDYWRRLEFTADQWRGLRDHARDRGLLFLSSPFSPEAVDLLRNLDVPAWKIASGEVTNTPLIRHILTDKRPLLISSGLCHPAELEHLAEMCAQEAVAYGLLECTTAYPCPPERINLARMCDFERRFHVPVGISDHSGTIFPSLAAVTLGACIIEVHVTFDKRMFGPDVPASVSIEELKEIVRGTRFIEKMRLASEAEPSPPRSAHEMRMIFGKSVVARRALPAGTKLSHGDLACKKPGDGIPACKFDDVLGRVVARDVEPDELIKWEDLK